MILWHHEYFEVSVLQKLKKSFHNTLILLSREKLDNHWGEVNGKCAWHPTTAMPLAIWWFCHLVLQNGELSFDGCHLFSDPLDLNTYSLKILWTCHHESPVTDTAVIGRGKNPRISHSVGSFKINFFSRVLINTLLRMAK